MDNNITETSNSTTETLAPKAQWSKPVLQKLDLNEALSHGINPHNDGSFPYS